METESLMKDKNEASRRNAYTCFFYHKIVICFSKIVSYTMMDKTEKSG